MQIWPWSTEWGKAKANLEFCQENSLVIANTLFQQHKRRLYTWTSPDGQHHNQTDYSLCGQRWKNSIQWAKQDQKLTVAQITNFLLPNSDWNWRKQAKPLDHSGIVFFSIFFYLSVNLAIRSSWSEPQSAPGLVFVDCIELLHLWLQRI